MCRKFSIYDHRQWKTRGLVRSPIVKSLTGRLVVGFGDDQRTPAVVYAVIFFWKSLVRNQPPSLVEGPLHIDRSLPLFIIQTKGAVSQQARDLLFLMELRLSKNNSSGVERKTFAMPLASCRVTDKRQSFKGSRRLNARFLQWHSAGALLVALASCSLRLFVLRA